MKLTKEEKARYKERLKAIEDTEDIADSMQLLARFLSEFTQKLKKSDNEQ